MPITFSDQSNLAIDTLVNLCSSSFDTPSNSLLVTPPLDELSKEDKNFEEEYVETEDTTPPDITSRMKAYRFSPPKRIIPDFTIAVDSGVINLGQLSGGGVAFAIRGAAICYSGKNLLILRYNTGALLLTLQGKREVFRYIGKRLGKADLYVEEIEGQLVPRPSAIDTVNQMQDRCRNFVERMIQEEALGILAANGGGILLIDGALARSFDTPNVYLEQMLTTARENSIDVCALSKRSRITLGGVPIDSLFDAYPTFVGYTSLLSAFRAESNAYARTGGRLPEDITAGTEIFAARFGFGPPGLTFRVDVSKSWGSTDSDVINDVYSKCQMYGGYPKPLIDAHQYSSFLGGEALNLLADLVVRTNLRVKERPSMDVLFQPFGAFGK